MDPATVIVDWASANQIMVSVLLHRFAKGRRRSKAWSWIEQTGTSGTDVFGICRAHRQQRIEARGLSAKERPLECRPVFRSAAACSTIRLVGPFAASGRVGSRRGERAELGRIGFGFGF